MNSKWIKRLGAWACCCYRACFSVGSVSASQRGRGEYLQRMGRLLPISLPWEPFLTSGCLPKMPLMIMQQAEQALYGCDSLLSWREEGSLAYRFNTEHQADMSEMKEVLEDALQVSKDSQGAFDLTVLPLSQLWNFDRLGDSDFDVSTMESPGPGRHCARPWRKWIIHS